MSAVHPLSLERRRSMLRTAMGAEIAAALTDPGVIEVMINPDGALRLDRLGEGRINTGTHLRSAEVERIIRLVASHIRLEVHRDSPIVSAELPGGGERFEPPPYRPAMYARQPPRAVMSCAPSMARGSATKPFTCEPSSRVTVPMASGGGTSTTKEPKAATGSS